MAESKRLLILSKYEPFLTSSGQNRPVNESELPLFRRRIILPKQIFDLDSYLLHRFVIFKGKIQRIVTQTTFHLPLCDHGWAFCSKRPNQSLQHVHTQQSVVIDTFV
jgi:hypothetical protein